MQGSRSNRLSVLLLSGLVALTVVAPAHAVDYESISANRTGFVQFGQKLFLDGPEIFTETILKEPFDQAETEFIGFDTSLYFSDAQDKPILPTNDAVAPPESVAHVGFSVADHRFSLFGTLWTDQNGNPTQEVVDPSASYKWDPKTNMVSVTLRNDTQRTVLLLRGRFSLSFSNPRFEAQVTDPLPPMGPFGPNGPRIGTFPKETVLLSIGDMIMPPFPAEGSVRTFQMRLGGNNNNDGGGGGPLFAIAPTASPYVIFRTIGYFPEDVNHRNPAAMLISDQPTRNYATCLFGEGGCIVGYPTSTGMLPVLLHVYSKDAEGGIPTVVLDTVKPTDAGAPASDAVIDPSYVTKQVAYDRFGYPVTEWSFLVWVRQSSTKERHYWVRFKAPDAKLECTLTVDPW